MQVKLLREAGLEEALFGLSLSYNVAPNIKIANKLANKDGGHNKFLESIVVWLDIDAPREWWQQFDTYRCGVTKQSESTMHTLVKYFLTPEDFEPGVDQRVIDVVNECIRQKDWIKAKRNLPEGFLQRRIVCTNYKAIRGILRQREDHRLYEWKLFCSTMRLTLKHPEWL